MSDETRLAALLHEAHVACWYSDVGQEVPDDGPRDCSPALHGHDAARLIASGVRVGDDGLRALAKLGASYQHLERLGIMLDPPHGHGTLWECEAKRCVEARALAWTPEERAAKGDAALAAQPAPPALDLERLSDDGTEALWRRLWDLQDVEGRSLMVELRRALAATGASAGGDRLRAALEAIVDDMPHFEPGPTPTWYAEGWERCARDVRAALAYEADK